MDFRYFRIEKNKKESTVFIISYEDENKCLSYLNENAHAIYETGRLNSERPEHLLKLKLLLLKAHTLVITKIPIKNKEIAELLCESHLRGLKVVRFDDYTAKHSFFVNARSECLIHFLTTKSQHQDWFIKAYRSLKNVFEPIIALIFFIILLPISLLTAIAIATTSKGPIIYRQVRLGQNGRPFNIYKFRSMNIDSEKTGPQWASSDKNDPRLTPIGAFLRHTHLDEIPQLLNIICGDLSFIGPRPERPEFTNRLEKIYPLFRLRLQIKPGITGWAQVNQGYVNSFDDSLRKLEFDLYYIMKHSPSLDFSIATKTLALIFSGGTEGLKRKNTYSYSS